MAFMWKQACRNLWKFSGLKILDRSAFSIVCHKKLCSLQGSVCDRLLVKEGEERTISTGYESINGYSCDSLFSKIDPANFTIPSALALLNTLANYTEQGYIKPTLYSDDKRFKIFCEQVQGQIDHFSNVGVITALKYLLKMGISPEDKTLQFFENEVLWRIRKMSFKSLNICLHFHCQHRATQLQDTVCTELINAIRLRWVEVEDVEDVIKNLEKSLLFDEQFLSRIENHALTLTEKMTLDELYRLCVALAKAQRRPMPLLRSISYHFATNTKKLNVRKTINLLHSLNTLNFADTEMLKKLSTDLLPEVPTLKGNIMYSLLTTIGLLRWRHPELLDVSCEWILNNTNTCRSQELVSCIITLATLNYKPVQEDALFAAVLPKMNPKLVGLDTIWLDVVYSLTILGKASAEHVASILNPSFYNALYDADAMCKLKIMSINAVAKLELPAATFSQDWKLLFGDIEVPRSNVTQKNQEAIITSLSNFVPPEKFMATNLNTSLGFLIDAEFILDNYGKPVPISQYGVRAGIGRELKPLPEGFKRVALLIWQKKDYTLHTSSLTGKNSLTVRLLKKLGYSVVQIQHGEFQMKNTIVKQVQYLQSKINEKLKITKGEMLGKKDHKK